MTEYSITTIVVQAALVLAGLALWINSLARDRQRLPWNGLNRLAHLDIPLTDFLLLLFFVILLVFFGSQAAVYWTDQSALEAPDNLLRQSVISGYMFHLCSIVAWILFGLYHPSIWPGRRLPWFPSVMAGLRGLLFALPVLVVISLGWSRLLEWIGLPTAPQDLIGVFQNAEETGYLTALGLLAVLVAPINEELLFRGGLFRFLRSRMPTAVAMVLSSVLFAMLHMNWFSFLPLVVLGCFLCLVTLKTGSLKPAIILHVLFNLNTVLTIVNSS